MAHDIDSAAQLAAKRLEAMLLQMLRDGEFGEVCIVVTHEGLKPIKRVTEEQRTIRIAQGYSLIQTR